MQTPLRPLREVMIRSLTIDIVGMIHIFDNNAIQSYSKMKKIDFRFKLVC